MGQVIQVLVFGLVKGSTYSLLALGVVLVFRGSKVLNFAQGEIGTASLFVAWFCVSDHHLPYWVGALAAIATATVVGLAFEFFVVRRMTHAPRLALTVATVGLLLFVIAIESYTAGGNIFSLRGPVAGIAFTVARVPVSGNQVIALAVVAALAVGLSVLLRRSDFGLGVLAAADDPTAVRLVGVPLSRVSAFTWAGGAALAAVAALLIEPTIGVFSPGFGSRLFLFSIVAAVVGGLTSLEGALIGGLVVGLLEAAVKQVVLTNSVSLPGLEVVAVFALLVAVLLVRPEGLLGRVAR